MNKMESSLESSKASSSQLEMQNQGHFIIESLTAWSGLLSCEGHDSQGQETVGE